ncbi:hypothetical protein [uncultured Roseibium sp.]|uniref:anti-sigma factor family protein n=1 Tax=uncultured Roseibium sp. TaxID=1936171 RepID=UPI002619BE2E|nr:hypothetical protein [uncultured Roseibium sp.]
MMDETNMTDEIIMAYADGQLSDADARKVEIAAEADETIRQKIRMFKETASQLKTAAAELPPIPDALAERISSMLGTDGAEPEAPGQDNVVRFARRNWIRQWPTAIAASITLVAGLAAGMAIGPFGGSKINPPFGITALADPEIAVALSSIESGSSAVLGSGATLNVIASFVDADNTLCREFDYEAVNGPSIVSVACHVGDAWHPKIAIAANTEQSANFAPASSLEALETWLATSGFGDPLEPEEEKQQLGGLGTDA